jgi:signal peptidase I
VPIDGRKIEFPHDEHRGPQADQANLENVTIPADNYFVLGDNRAASADSRSFGAVPRKQFVGKVVLRIWPPGGVRGG